MTCRFLVLGIALVLGVGGCRKTTEHDDVRKAESLYDQGVTQYENGQYADAIDYFDQSLALEPNYPLCYLKRGMAHEGLKNWDKAIGDYTRCAEIDPKARTARHANHSLAFIYATCPNDSVRDGKKAVELATKACESTGWTDPMELSTLAAAYAEVRRFPEAVKRQKQALELTGASKPEQIEHWQECLKLYETNKPFRSQ